MTKSVTLLFAVALMLSLSSLSRRPLAQEAPPEKKTAETASETASTSKKRKPKKEKSTKAKKASTNKMKGNRYSIPVLQSPHEGEPRLGLAVYLSGASYRGSPANICGVESSAEGGVDS